MLKINIKLTPNFKTNLNIVKLEILMAITIMILIKQ